MTTNLDKDKKNTEFNRILGPHLRSKVWKALMAQDYGFFMKQIWYKNLQNMSIISLLPALLFSSGICMDKYSRKARKIAVAKNVVILYEQVHY